MESECVLISQQSRESMYGNPVSLSARKKVLVVEDDPFSQKYFSKILSDRFVNLELVFAKDYESALEAIRNYGNFDLAILDIFLAGDKSGVDLYRTLLKTQPPSAIIMTSALEAENYSKLFPEDLAVPPFLKKPFQPDACADLLDVFMGSGLQ